MPAGDWLRIAVSAPGDRAEELLPTLIELGCAGFEETPTHLIGYVRLPSDPRAASELREAFAAVLRRISVNAEIAFEEIPDRNWNAEWERTVQPVEIGERIAIAPSWSGYRNPRRIVLTIDPKMAFGTGYHETTRLMLRLLERHVVAGAAVLDVGTGTGVLAIAAVLLGAARAEGTDTDEWAVSNALENVARNDVGGRVNILHGTLPPAGGGSPPDLLCANLTLNDLRELLGDFRRILRPGGILLVSGLLTADEQPITTALGEAGFRVIELMRENEWLAIAAR